MPYGIDTVSLFAHIFLVMLPVKLAAISGGASSEEAAGDAYPVAPWAIGYIMLAILLFYVDWQERRKV